MNQKTQLLVLAAVLLISLFFSACEFGTTINDYSPVGSWNPSFSFETESGMILSPESIDSENQVIQLNLNSGVTGFYVDVAGSDTIIAWEGDSTSVSNSGGRIYVTLLGTASQGTFYVAPYEGADTMYVIMVTQYSAAPDGQSVAPDYNITIIDYPQDGIYQFGMAVVGTDPVTGTETLSADIVLGDYTISGGTYTGTGPADSDAAPSFVTGQVYTLVIYADINASGSLDVGDMSTTIEIEYDGTNPWSISTYGSWSEYYPANIEILDDLIVTGADNPDSIFTWSVDGGYTETETDYTLTTTGESGVIIQVAVKDPAVEVEVWADTLTGSAYTLTEAENWTSSRIDLNGGGSPTTVTITTSCGDYTETYNLSITRLPGTSADVETVEVEGIEILDTDGDDVFQAGIPAGTNSASFMIASADPYAAITFHSVNPWTETGVISGAYGLSEIDNPDIVDFSILSEDGNTEQYYTLEFYDQADSSLANLSLDAGTISFSPTDYSYNVTVPADTESVVITAAPTDASATVETIPASTFTGNQSSPIALAQGTTTDITVRCTNLGEAGDMDDSVTDYVISVYRPELWTDLGGETVYDGDIYRGELHEYNGKLYALGVHNGDWGIQDTSVWEYDSGSDSWNVLGSEQAVDGSFYTTMTIDPTDGTIYILSGMNVYTWSGTSWNQLGGSVGSTGTGQSYSITVDPSNGDVYVAYADDTTADYYQTVKKWNGSSWELVGASGFSTESADNSEIFFFNGDLYVLSGDADLRLYRWDGSSWIEDDYVNSSYINDVYTVNDGTDGVLLGYIEGGMSAYAPSVRYYDSDTSLGTQIGSTQFAPALSYHIALAINPATGALLAGYQTGDSDVSDPVVVSYWDGTIWEELAEVDSFDRMTSMDMVILDGALYIGYGDGDSDEYMVKKYNGTLP